MLVDTLRHRPVMFLHAVECTLSVSHGHSYASLPIQVLYNLFVHFNLIYRAMPIDALKVSLRLVERPDQKDNRERLSDDYKAE
jgi:hypothetical protein